MNTIDRASVERAVPRARMTRRIAATVWTALGMGVLLLLNKLRQTPELALRYSRQTQEEVGYWVMALVALFLVTLMCWAMAVSARRSLRGHLEPYPATILRRLAQARASCDISTQVEAESELRRLEPHRDAADAAPAVAAAGEATSTSAPGAPGAPAATTTAAADNRSPAVAGDRYDQLAKVKRLLDDGVLDAVEYARERQRILARD
jgi:hypothetical protein